MRSDDQNVPLKTSACPASQSPLVDELDDAALEHVVGGLARAWFDNVTELARVRQHEITNGIVL